MRHIRILMLFGLLLLFHAGLAEEMPPMMTAQIPAESGMAEIDVKQVYGESWLFLPAFAQNDEVKLFANGEKLGWEAEETEYGELWQVSGQGKPLHVMHSSNLRTLFLFSADPVNEGRDYIDNCPGHINETTGSIALVSPDGTVDYAGNLRQLRGRGNGTWSHDKKPYQFKLEEKADLLKTGDPAEKNRTWVLLAEATDPTMLHNRIALDLALEMGMESTSQSEFVDLYYDGDYRGTYLLAEKVQINEGRIDVLNYEDLLETWNGNMAGMTAENLHVSEGENRFGNPYSYVAEMTVEGEPDLGSYLIEMQLGQDEMCAFKLNDDSGMYYTIKNPEVASDAMMRYVSERVQEAKQTLLNGGVHPESGRTIEDDFDVDSFVRLALLAEFTYNLDAFSYASTWLVLPAGETQLKAGPAWDVDLAFRYFLDGSNAGAVGLKENDGWMHDFYSCEPFVRAMQAVYRDEMYPLIQEILLGEKEGRYLRPLDAYLAELDASGRMDRKIWNGVKDHRLEYGDSYEDEVFMLRQFVEERSEWLHQALVAHDVWDTEYLEMEMEVVYGHADQLILRVFPWTQVDITYETEQLTEADDMDYAWYRADVYVTPKEGKTFDSPELTVNGSEFMYEMLEDGSLHFAVEYEDYSYRTCYYDDVDIGLIYNYDIYMEEYPEVAEECGYDEELMMEYFCTTGMESRHIGNRIFSPMDLRSIPEAYEECKSWPEYYWALLDHGWGDGWLEEIQLTFLPELSDVL